MLKHEKYREDSDKRITKERERCDKLMKKISELEIANENQARKFKDEKSKLMTEKDEISK